MQQLRVFIPDWFLRTESFCTTAKFEKNPRKVFPFFKSKENIPFSFIYISDGQDFSKMDVIGQWKSFARNEGKPGMGGRL